MRFVLDQNSCHAPELAEYLKSGNEIILIDDFFVESFKSESSICRIYHNLELLRQFPNQVSATYSSGDLFRKELALCAPLKSEQLISADLTSTVRRLLSLEYVKFKNEFTRLKHDATNRIADKNDFTEKYIREGAQETSDLIKEEGKMKEYRTDCTEKLKDMRETAFQVLELILKTKHPENYDFKQFKCNNSVIFSSIYIHLWRIIDWAIKNGFKNAKKKIQGDSFDIKYVLIGCFFDGIMTNDCWLKKCREDTIANFIIV